MAFALSVMDAARTFPESQLFLCCLCGDPVDLRTAKTEEYGKAIHEDCYVQRMRNEIETRYAPALSESVE